MNRWLCFALGLNNFAGGRSVSMPQILESVSDDPDLALVASFAATGNISIASDLSADDIAHRLGEFSEQLHPWAVVPPERVVQYVEEIEQAKLPPPKAGERWTLGIALPITPPKGSVLKDTERVRLWWTKDRRAAAAAKVDIVDDRGRLDSTQRRGGWGGISGDIEDQIGGRWTARSLRTVKGLIRATSLNPS